MPPPLVAELLLTVLLSSVRAPLMSMPPPESAGVVADHGAGQGECRPRRRRCRRRHLSRLGLRRRPCSPGGPMPTGAAGASVTSAGIAQADRGVVQGDAPFKMYMPPPKPRPPLPPSPPWPPCR